MINRVDFIRLVGLDICTFDQRRNRGQLAGELIGRPRGHYTEFDVLLNRLVQATRWAGIDIFVAVNMANRTRRGILRNWPTIVERQENESDPDIYIAMGECSVTGTRTCLCGSLNYVCSELVDNGSTTIFLINLSSELDSIIITAEHYHIKLAPDFITADYKPPYFVTEQVD